MKSIHRTAAGSYHVTIISLDSVHRCHHLIHKYSHQRNKKQNPYVFRLNHFFGLGTPTLSFRFRNKDSWDKLIIIGGSKTGSWILTDKLPTFKHKTAVILIGKSFRYLHALSDNSIWSEVSVVTINHIRTITTQCSLSCKLLLNSAVKIFQWFPAILFKNHILTY